LKNLIKKYQDRLFFVLVKSVLLSCLIFLPLLESQAQSRNIQHYTYTEENSNLGSSICYNWSQLPNGELFVSGNHGISSFDGKDFSTFITEGRGKAISSSIHDQTGRLWCNSFHGDIYYFEDDVFKRHSISDDISELTGFFKSHDHFLLYSEKTVYEINQKTLEIVKIASFDLIMSIFEHRNEIYVWHTKNGINGYLYELNTGSSRYLNIPPDMQSNCVYIRDSQGDKLLFTQSKILIPVFSSYKYPLIPFFVCHT
jgi:hypothetical protein